MELVGPNSPFIKPQYNEDPFPLRFRLRCPHCGKVIRITPFAEAADESNQPENPGNPDRREN